MLSHILHLANPNSAIIQSLARQPIDLFIFRTIGAHYTYKYFFLSINTALLLILNLCIKTNQFSVKRLLSNRFTEN